MKYTLLKPCIVPQENGSALSHRKFGEEIDVPNQDDADRLVAGGFLKPVEEEQAEAEVDGVAFTDIFANSTPPFTEDKGKPSDDKTTVTDDKGKPGGDDKTAVTDDKVKPVDKTASARPGGKPIG